MFLIGIIATITISIIIIQILIRDKKIRNEYQEEYLNYSKIKGEYGENSTTEEFKNFFDDNSVYYKILKNTYLPYSDNKTTEIDIIIISEYGIIAVENKNYSGWIFGSFNANKWTATYWNGTKFQFYNPIKQNYTHIEILKKYIDNKYHNKIYSYIVFNQECELKQVPYNSEFIKIIQDYEIYETLSENINSKCLTADEIELLYNTLIEFTNVSNEVKEMHIKGVSEVVKN